MNDILSLNINFEKHVLELRTEEFEDGCGQSFMLVGDEDGIVINYYWRE